MTALEVAVHFTVAWLAVGLGLFIAMGSLRSLRPAVARGPWRPAYALPLLLSLGLLGAGSVEVMRVLPW